MFSKEVRCVYGSNQLANVICQLRFPEILAISATPPVAFQDAIRDTYPLYMVKKEAPAPKIVGTPGKFAVEEQPISINHQFTSQDGIWQVNLTSRFISLACTSYTQWEDFAKQLDRPLAAFIQLYKPAFFQRIGLRYMNFFSRKSLSLEGTPFSELFQPCYLGPLADEDVPEHTSSRCSIDTELAIRGGCRAKIHAGPGLVKRNGKADTEIKFIFDQDIFMPGDVPVNLSAGALQTLHTQAFSIFRGAITDTLHEAMDPTPIL